MTILFAENHENDAFVQAEDFYLRFAGTHSAF